jgi:hypothetical protein
MRANMIRVQFTLDQHEYAKVKREARAAGLSVAEYVRRAIRQVVPARTDAPWMGYAGSVESGNIRSSHTIDEIVYGFRD